MNSSMTEDLEMATKPMAPPSKSTAFMEAAALLTIWSLLVINEGSIRLNQTAPSVDLFSAGSPSKSLLFFASLAEVAFGLLGFYIGISAFLLRWYNTNILKASMVLQTILGYYVFIIYVFVQPIFNVVNTTAPTIPGLSLSQTRAMQTMGLLTSFNFCLALQGGQFVFMARLIVAGTGNDFLRQKTGLRMRAIFWNVNLALSGLWTLITGLIVAVEATQSGRLDGPFVSPPNVGVLPGLTIWTGVLLLFWGSVGVAHAVTRRRVGKMYYVVTGYVYLSALLNYGIVQFGLFATPDGMPSPSWAVALHNGLVFMVVFMGAYFVHKMFEEESME